MSGGLLVSVCFRFWFRFRFRFWFWLRFRRFGEVACLRKWRSKLNFVYWLSWHFILFFPQRFFACSFDWQAGCNRETDKGTSQGGGAATIYAIYGPTDVKLTLPKPLNRFHWRIQWQRQTERERERERESIYLYRLPHMAQIWIISLMDPISGQIVTSQGDSPSSSFLSARLSGIALVAIGWSNRVTYRPIDWHTRCIHI